jgi:hypothetical protein
MWLAPCRKTSGKPPLAAKVRFPPKTDITVVSINRSGKLGAGREQGLRVALLGTVRLVLPTGPFILQASGRHRPIADVSGVVKTPGITR